MQAGWERRRGHRSRLVISVLSLGELSSLGNIKLDDALKSRLDQALAAGASAQPLSVMIVLPQNGPATVDEVTDFIGKRGGSIEFTAKLTRSVAATMSAQSTLELTHKFKYATVTLNEPGELEN